MPATWVPWEFTGEASYPHTPVNADGVLVPYDPSGVAPRALLGNYNVFPGDIADAKSEDILKALETA